MVSSIDDLNVTLGIEEEYFLVDAKTRQLVLDPDPGILEYCKNNRGAHNFVPELLRSQIEANSCVCEKFSQVRPSITEMRGTIQEAAQKYGANIFAASLHPTSSWNEQLITKGERYERLTSALQHSSRQLIVGGMHIHAGFDDENRRIWVMTSLRRYMPILLALSTSSPLSEGKLTGFKSFRLNMIGNLPRTGIPLAMASMLQFERLLAEYKQMQFIDDASEIWWDIRPSHSYPTIELRICDVCPKIDDAMCIIALFTCLIRALIRLHEKGALPPEPRLEIINANKWLAQRYGVFALMGDTRDGGMVDFADAVERVIVMVLKEAQALGCEEEIHHAHNILRNGSSADRQIDHFSLRKLEGDSIEEALKSTVDLIVNESLEGVG